jgi:hypothetical protein
MTQRRIVSFAYSAVVIEWDGARAQAVIDFLFGDTSADDRIAPHTTFRLVSSEPSLALYRDDALMLTSNDDAQIAEYLLGEVSYHLADKSNGGLVLHAGALAWQGQGVLVAGDIGSGKTTLTAWLVSLGLDYLTDEMVFVPNNSDTLNAFVRPLNCKSPSRPVLQPFFDFDAHAGSIYHAPSADLIPPTTLRPTNVLSTPHLRLMLFPQYAPNTECEVKLLSKAQTGMALMQTCLNARNLPEQVLSQVAHLARVAPAYRLRYSSFDQIALPVELLLQKMASVL